MSNYLPNTSYYYDLSTAKEMDTFLKYIYTMVRCNPDTIISPKIIYNELCVYGLKNNELNNYRQGISIEHLYSKWMEKFAGRNVKVFRDFVNIPRLLQFVNPIKRNTDDYIKLYIPLDYEHVYEGVNQIFDFLDREGIEHESKIDKQMRSDNLIIRLHSDDFDNANKIINFVASNSKLRNGLNKLSPFVPTRKGIGILADHSASYNFEIATLINSFCYESFRSNKKDVSIEEFRAYLKKYCYDMNTLDTFALAFSGHSKVDTEGGIIKGPLSDEQKYMLFLNTLDNTYRNHGIKQAKSAIVHAIEDGDFDYFSRGDGNTRLRENLRRFVNSKELFNLINEHLKLLMDPNQISISYDGIASQFCDKVFSDINVMILDEAAYATIANHSIEQLEFAINKYIMTNSTNGFSRYSPDNQNINHRERVKYLDNKTLLSVIDKSLKIKGIDTSMFRINDLVNVYASYLSQIKYCMEDEKSMSAGAS